ncbi:short-chain dehydrogenase [Oleiphilus sp. HI0071]|uniref:SDR family oxidoreductase n=1 Tax=unclassified Oleiphilus TaxID=2631174 RepID=UPI0007C2FD51|nr:MULTISPECIES: SDR family oxidoreductase [unclassified Oleiphilus]KZY67256.1 short-chain dehydrogenase [Oleiphilus sp. HI0065]KZY78926.1 short-chain dehydrogenase [Oleiphilus sp. HI0071]KZY91868.1 short-chain dehydrogenase [Oleiphilus sp. HI0073]KZZ49819.1 short-chain dehydrogenase [Oleiphilus sp. HI0118]KZZ57945.1 short-chain dehydrogenase [Oleiphilus sp. HI0122]
MNNIFISGAAMGIGQATAQYFYARGWSVGVADVDKEKLEAFAEGKDATRFHTYECDVTNAEQVSSAMKDFCEKHDAQLEVLVNNAGWLKVGDFEELELADHHRTIDINVKGVLNCLYAAFPYLKNGKGTVINLSSASSSYGVPELSSYSASKFAVKAITEALELEWQKYSIKVCDVVPPFVNTHMLSSQTKQSRALSRMGANLVAGDVVRCIAKQVESPVLHRPVGWQYFLLHHLSTLTPTFLQRGLMKFLSRA